MFSTQSARNFLFILIACLQASACLAQSREETIEWLMEKSATSKYSLNIKHAIENGDFVMRYEMPYISGGGEIKKSVPLAQIKSIQHEHTETFLTFMFFCETADCAYMVQTDSDGKFKSEEKQERFLFEIYGKVDAALIPRIEKALLHLIKLEGGNAKLAPFVPKKEAF